MKKLIKVWDDDYQTVYLDEEWHNGDWNLRLAIRITDLKDFVSEDEKELLKQGVYEAEILAVSPEAAGKEKVATAWGYSGLDNPDFINRSNEDDYVALIEYGIYAPLVSKRGNNYKKLLAEIKKELVPVKGLFGFYMDRTLNRIGNDGWDFIQGELGFKS